VDIYVDKAKGSLFELRLASFDLRYVWINLNDINYKYNCEHIDIYGSASSDAGARRSFMV
jgi:hypothetical protein